MAALRRLWPFLRPHSGLLALSLFLVAGVSTLALLPPYLIGLIVDGAFGQGRWHLLLPGVLGIVGSAALQGALRYAQRLTAERVAQEVIFELRGRLFRHLQGLSFGFFDQSRTGELMSRVTADVDTLRHAMGMGAVNLVQQAGTLVGIVAVLFWKDWQLALAALSFFPLLVHAVLRFGRVVRPTYRKVQEETAALTAIVQENAGGIRVVRAFGQEEAEVQRLGAQNLRLQQVTVQSARLQAFWSQYMAFLSVCGLVAVLGFGGWQVQAGRLSIGDLVAFNTYIVLLAGPVRTIGWLLTTLARAGAGAQRIFELLDTQAEVRDRPDARPLPPVRGQIRFDKVTFAYAGGTVPALQDVSLEVRPGQKVAILGLTGSGKTTLVHLIPRFYDVSGGRLTIDGHDVRSVTLDSLRRQVAVVMQDTFLFSGTLQENIAYGRPHADLDDVAAAAAAAQIHDFIETLPQGYETVIGERGVRLSGGQKQRVAIARAILTGAPVVILDESTSSVDVATEARIHAAMDLVVQNRTAIIVAQRLSTVQSADLVVVLDGGRIVQMGTHVQLLAAGGLYRQVYELQLQGMAGPALPPGDSAMARSEVNAR